MDPRSLLTVQHDAFLSAMSSILLEMQKLSQRTESIAMDVASLTKQIVEMDQRNEYRWREANREIATMKEKTLFRKPETQMRSFDRSKDSAIQTEGLELSLSTQEDQEDPQTIDVLQASSSIESISVAEEPSDPLPLPLESTIASTFVLATLSKDSDVLTLRVDRLEEALYSANAAVELQEARFSAHVSTVEALSRITTQAQYTFEAHGQRLDEQEKTIQRLLLGLQDRISAASEQEQELEKVHASILRVQKSFKVAPKEQVSHTFQTDVMTLIERLQEAQHAQEEAISREIRHIHAKVSAEIDSTRDQFSVEVAHCHSKLKELSLCASESIQSMEKKLETATSTAASSHRALSAWILRICTQLYDDLLVVSKALRKSLASKRAHITKEAIDDTMQQVQGSMQAFERQSRSLPATHPLAGKARAFSEELLTLQKKLQGLKNNARADLYSQFAWPLTSTIDAHIRIFEGGKNPIQTEASFSTQSVVIQLHSALFFLCFQLHQWKLEEDTNSTHEAHDALCKRIAPLYLQADQLNATDASLQRIYSRLDSISALQLTFADDSHMKSAIQSIVTHTQTVRDQLTSFFLDQLAPVTQKTEILEREIHSISSMVTLKPDKTELQWLKETLEQKIEVLEHASPLDAQLAEIHRSLRSKIGKAQVTEMLASQPAVIEPIDTQPIASSKCISCNTTPSLQWIQQYISHQVQYEVSKSASSEPSSASFRE
uniref:Uncharacterized protein AlNc14C1G43 n=1 Tax=Albugo laibachii Nc14 TaxID=890382 RepID=F0VYP1_9STRA|nr:conserved hypothetical protein [Albugo laibachii Nc14]|eukprot:CCA13905.1 conserved hypothetical protein [Albugo laibachii Nc14]